jgi:hypothetical protein
MQSNVKQVVFVNNSSNIDRRVENLKNLQNAKFGNGGTVTYHFIRENVSLSTTREKYLKNSFVGEEYKIKSVLKQPLQDSLLSKRSATEVYTILESISNDLKASYFTVE